MSQSSEASMIGRRSELLATVLLTRRLNVDVHPFAAEEEGIDLICTIRLGPGDKLQGFLPFGVMVKGTARKLDTEQEATSFAHHHRKTFSADKFFMPVIVLLVSMQKDEAYFSWLVKPEKGSNKLVRCQELEFAHFGVRELDHLINAIKGWYEQLDATVVVDAGERNGSGCTASV